MHKSSSHPSHACTWSRWKDFVSKGVRPERLQESHHRRSHPNQEERSSPYRSVIGRRFIWSQNRNHTFPREYLECSQKRYISHRLSNLALTTRTPGRHNPQKTSQFKVSEGHGHHRYASVRNLQRLHSGEDDEKPFENQQKWDSHPFGTLHANLIGPMNPEARWTHARFCLVVNDDCSGFRFSFNLKHKDEVVKILIDLDNAIETKFQQRVHTLRTDNGSEFINHELQKHCED